MATTQMHHVGAAGQAGRPCDRPHVELVVLEPPADVGAPPSAGEGAPALAAWRGRMREAGALLSLAAHEALPLLGALEAGRAAPERIDRLLWEERILADAGPDGAHVRDWLAMAAGRGGACLLIGEMPLRDEAASSGARTLRRDPVNVPGNALDVPVRRPPCTHSGPSGR